jgi:hypothetical protein
MREPIEFCPGDTFTFTKYLPDYLPAQGYFIDLEIRGGAAVISLQSTPSADGGGHVILANPAQTALWLSGEMLMAEYVVNNTIAPPYRQQIYLAPILFDKNLQGSNANIPVKTFAQINLENMEKCMLNFSSSGLLETRIGETMFRYTTVKDLYWAYGMAKQIRKNEIAVEYAKNGQKSPYKSKPQARITSTGSPAGQTLYPFGWGAI